MTGWRGLLEVAPLRASLEGLVGALSSPGRVPVFMFHGAGDPRILARVLDRIAERGRALSVAEFEDALEAGVAPGPGSCLLTFDDAYEDFASVAWPQLRERGLPAVLFVPTGFPDSGRTFWWDDLGHALAHTERTVFRLLGREVALTGPSARRVAWKDVRRWVKAAPHERVTAELPEWLEQLGVPSPGPRVLGWDALRELAADGVALAAHTRDHPMLPVLDEARQEQEIRDSLLDLTERLGTSLDWFAYPSGRYDERSVRAARAAGVRLAFTTDDGLVDLRSSDRLRLPRVALPEDTPPGQLAARWLRASSRGGRSRGGRS